MKKIPVLQEHSKASAPFGANLPDWEYSIYTNLYSYHYSYHPFRHDCEDFTENVIIHIAWAKKAVCLQAMSGL
ncbi:MAG: hypothetical protein LBD89_06565 [Tannerellaceae bacterium]|jgi:hypothetical protein|nr:hypothetical protein [Tannerellaceae bacterium]